MSIFFLEVLTQLPTSPAYTGLIIWHPLPLSHMPLMVTHNTTACQFSINIITQILISSKEWRFWECVQMSWRGGCRLISKEWLLRLLRRKELRNLIMMIVQGLIVLEGLWVDMRNFSWYKRWIRYESRYGCILARYQTAYNKWWCSFVWSGVDQGLWFEHRMKGHVHSHEILLERSCDSTLEKSTSWTSPSLMPWSVCSWYDWSLERLNR